MASLSIALPRRTVSLDRAPVLYYAWFNLVMDEKGHGHKDMGVIMGLIRRYVDESVVEKLVRTIRHDLRQRRR
jgi:hypothetical protein